MTDFEALRRQADDAAREACQRWEHCKDGEIFAIAYPWFLRPDILPLSHFEIELAFKLASRAGSELGLNRQSGRMFEIAALILRVSTERLQRAVIGTKFNRKRKESPDVDSPVRWQEGPGRRIVTVRRMPGDGKDTISVDFNHAGDAVITIQRQSTNYLRLAEVAKRVLEESE